MRLGCITTLIVLVFLGIVGAAAYPYYVGGTGESVHKITLESGDPDTVVRELSDARILNPWNAMVFRFAAEVTNAEDAFHAGTFLIPERASVREIILKLQEPVRAEATVTFPEGSDLRDIARILKSEGLLGREKDLYAVTGEPAVFGAPAIGGEDFPFLGGKPKNISLEGYLLPDTYRFFTDATPEDVVRKMLRNFDTRTAELRTGRLPDGLSFHDVLTLASVVEAEVRGKEDRRKVADLFLRRIAAGMGLQADSTVNYFTGNGGVFTTAPDRTTENLWNTYKYRGLPPGPIGNPGLEAIRAVLDPIPNTAVYFLTAPDGTVYYAETLEEHAANKRHL